MVIQISCRTKIEDLLQVEYSKITKNELMKVPSNIVAQYSAYLASQLSERTKVDNIVKDFKLDIINTIAETVKSEVKAAVQEEVKTLRKADNGSESTKRTANELVSTELVSLEKFNKVELDIQNMYKEVNTISNVVHNMSIVLTNNQSELRDNSNRYRYRYR